MEKAEMTRAELEFVVLAELRASPDCEDAVHVTVVPYIDFRASANWQVASFDPGISEWSCCERALCAIVQSLQQRFDIRADSQLR